jgi:uncharacterized protein YhbP (UPF0306 family)
LNVGGDQFEPRLRLVTELLRSQSTMTLSTCDDAGWPQATPLFYYAGDDLELYWFSSMRSAHSKHVVREPRVAVTVFRPTEHWQEICGVQMRGEAMEVSGPKRRAITALYCERFQLGAVFGLTITRSRLFGFQPSWIRYLDNAKGLGFKFEVTLPHPVSDCPAFLA